MMYRLLPLLALCCLTAASEPDCSELVKTLEDISHIHGKWIYHAGSADTEENLNVLKTLKSSWIDLSATSDSSVVKTRWGDNYDGGCNLGEADAIFSEGNTKVTANFGIYRVQGKYLQTCPDCLLWTDSTETTTAEGTKIGRYIHIFTRTGTLEASQLEVFKKQAACLNFRPEIHLTGTTNLCPDTKASQ